MPEQAPDGSIIISPKEFYDGVQSDIRVIKEAVSPLPELRGEVKLHGDRLNRLERVAWVALGIALASGSNDLLGMLAR